MTGFFSPARQTGVGRRSSPSAMLNATRARFFAVGMTPVRTGRQPAEASSRRRPGAQARAPSTRPTSSLSYTASHRRSRRHRAAGAGFAIESNHPGASLASSAAAVADRRRAGVFRCRRNPSTCGLAAARAAVVSGGSASDASSRALTVDSVRASGSPSPWVANTRPA